MLRLRCTLQPTNTRLLLHFKSHVEDRYKRGLLKNDAWSCISTFIQLPLLLWRMWLTEIIVFSTKISWQTCQLFHFTVCCRQSIGLTCFLTYCQRSISPNSCCIIHRSTRPFSLYLSRLNKISNCEKLSRRLWTNSALFTSLNVTSMCDAGYVGFTRRHLHHRVKKTQKLFFIN